MRNRLPVSPPVCSIGGNCSNFCLQCFSRSLTVQRRFFPSLRTCVTQPVCLRIYNVHNFFLGFTPQQTQPDKPFCVYTPLSVFNSFLLLNFPHYCNIAWGNLSIFCIVLNQPRPVYNKATAVESFAVLESLMRQFI